MMLFFVLLAATEIDGLFLWKRAQATPNEKAYSKYLTCLKEEALTKALVAADDGEYKLVYCWDPENSPGKRSQAEIRSDLLRIFSRIDGLTATYVPNRPCVELDWSRP